MSREDELRNRVSRLADAADIPELTLDDVERRGKQRVNHQRLLAVAAAFLLVVGAVGAVKLLDQSGSKDADVASSDAETTTGDGEDSQHDSAEAETVEASPTTTVVVSELFADDSYGRGGYFDGGPSWILPWGDGFVSLAQVFEPSDATLRDLVPDIEDRLGGDVVAELVAAGVDLDAVGSEFDETFYRAMESEGLWHLEESIWGDPVVSRAFSQVMQGGTIRPEASVSSDGLNWTVVEGFELPGSEEHFGHVQSDGERLVVGTQEWDPDTQTTSEISVSFTKDLDSWQTVVIPASRPDVPAYVNADTSLGSMVMTDDGVFVMINTWAWVDLWNLLPADVHAEMEENGWGWEPAPEGVRLVDYSAWEEAEWEEAELAADDPAADSTTYPTTLPPPLDSPVVPQEPVWEPPVMRTISWSELGLSWDEYQSFTHGDSGSTEAFMVGWDGAVDSATVPIGAGCCTIIATDAGLLAQAWGGEEHYFEGDVEGEDPWEPTPQRLFFSADGNSWSEISGPLEAGWYEGMAAVAGGVLLLGSEPWDESATDQPGRLLWLGAPDGSSWESITIPGLDASQYLWFNNMDGPNGVASVVDRATYEEFDYEYVEPPVLAGLDVTTDLDGYMLSVTTGDDGTAHMVVTDVDGADVLDYTSDWPVHYPEDLFEMMYIASTENDVDQDLVGLFEGQSDTFFDLVYRQAEEIRAEAGWEEPVYPEYFPDMWLVATADGIHWLVEDLPDPNSNDQEAWFNAVPGINGDTVTVSIGDDWTTFTIG